MEYRSYADLTRAVTNGLWRVPADVDLVVAIPRSGIVPATVIALGLNVPTTDVDGLLSDRLIASGHTRRLRRPCERVSDCRHALVVDDSVRTGTTLEAVKSRIAAAKLPIKISYAAVYATRDSVASVDLYFAICPLPRLFEWNYLHHKFLATACVDIDGVLCLDPTASQNDDGARYLRFLRTARPFYRPTHRIHHLVTSRLERYRRETEEWLQRNNIEFDRLSMIDVPDAATRRRRKLHASFKGEVFRQDKEATFFIESDLAQAPVIASISGKPVLCTADQKLYRPRQLSLAHATQQVRSVRQSAFRRLRLGASRWREFWSEWNVDPTRAKP